MKSKRLTESDCGVFVASKNRNCGPNAKERLFSENHAKTCDGILGYEPGFFRIFVDGTVRRYTPDFWCSKCECYFEVVGSRQAISFSLGKINAVRQSFPDERILIVTPTGDPYRLQERGRPPKNLKKSESNNEVELARETISFRLPRSLADWIRQSATKDGRTASRFIMRILESEMKCGERT